MKRILRYFGYISIPDLAVKATTYAVQQDNKANAIVTVGQQNGGFETLKKTLRDSSDARNKGIGALEFINTYLRAE